MTNMNFPKEEQLLILESANWYVDRAIENLSKIQSMAGALKQTSTYSKTAKRLTHLTMEHMVKDMELETRINLATESDYIYGDKHFAMEGLKEIWKKIVDGIKAVFRFIVNLVRKIFGLGEANFSNDEKVVSEKIETVNKAIKETTVKNDKIEIPNTKNDFDLSKVKVDPVVFKSAETSFASLAYYNYAGKDDFVDLDYILTIVNTFEKYVKTTLVNILLSIESAMEMYITKTERYMQGIKNAKSIKDLKYDKIPLLSTLSAIPLTERNMFEEITENNFQSKGIKVFPHIPGAAHGRIKVYFSSLVPNIVGLSFAFIDTQLLTEQMIDDINNNSSFQPVYVFKEILSKDEHITPATKVRFSKTEIEELKRIVSVVKSLNEKMADRHKDIEKLCKVFEQQQNKYEKIVTSVSLNEGDSDENQMKTKILKTLKDNSKGLLSLPIELKKIVETVEQVYKHHCKIILDDIGGYFLTGNVASL